MEEKKPKYRLTIKVQAETSLDLADCLREAQLELARGGRKIALVGVDTFWSLELEENP